MSSFGDELYRDSLRQEKAERDYFGQLDKEYLSSAVVSPVFFRVIQEKGRHTPKELVTALHNEVPGIHASESLALAFLEYERQLENVIRLTDGEYETLFSLRNECWYGLC